MILFLIFLIPLCLALIIVNFNRNEGKLVLPLLPFFLGLLLFVPSLLLYWITAGLLEPSYTAAGFYFHTLLKEHLLFLLFAFGWLVVLRQSLLFRARENSFYKILAFFGGYYSAVNVHEYLARLTHLDAYALFLLPLLNLSAVVLAAVLLSLFLNSYGLVRSAFLAALIAVPLGLTLVTVLFLRNAQAWAVVLTVLITGVTGLLFFLRRESLE